MEPINPSPASNEPETASADTPSPVPDSTNTFGFDSTPTPPIVSGIITPDVKPTDASDVVEISYAEQPASVPEAAPTSAPEQVSSAFPEASVGESFPAASAAMSSQATNEVTPATDAGNADTAVPQPAMAGVSAVGSSEPPIAPDGQKPKPKRRWLLPIGIGIAVLLLLSGAYVFGLYLPNRPTAVYSKSMSRTADATDVLVKYAQTQATAKYTGASVDGTYSGKLSSVAFDGTIKAQTDGSNATTVLTADIAGQKLNLETRSIKVPQSVFPDIYAKVSGLDSVSSVIGTSLASSLNNQWIVFDHTLLDTLQSSATGSSATSSATPTLSQIDDAAGKVQAVNREYLFSNNADKAIFTYGSFVGAETKDGQKVNHYKVSYNKSHLKAYASAIGTALDGSSLNDWAKKQYDGKNISEVVDLNGLQKSIDSSKSGTTFDMYVNLKTKLVQSLHYAQKQESGNGTDAITISQLYTGSGTTYPFQLDFSTTGSTGSDMQGTLKLSVDTKANTVHFGGAFTSLVKGDDSRLSLTVDAKPTTAPLTVTAPTGAKSYNDIMTEIIGSPGVLGAETNTPNVNILQGLQQRL